MGCGGLWWAVVGCGRLWQAVASCGRLQDIVITSAVSLLSVTILSPFPHVGPWAAQRRHRSERLVSKSSSPIPVIPLFASQTVSSASRSLNTSTRRGRYVSALNIRGVVAGSTHGSPCDVSKVARNGYPRCSPYKSLESPSRTRRSSCHAGMCSTSKFHKQHR